MKTISNNVLLTCQTPTQEYVVPKSIPTEAPETFDLDILKD